MAADPSVLLFPYADGNILSPEVIGLNKKIMVPYEKMSKKARKELDSRKRRNWGGLNPATRKPVNPKAYDRNKEKARSFDPEDQLRVFC